MNIGKILLVIRFVDGFYIHKKLPSIKNHICYNQEDSSSDYCDCYYEETDCSCDCYLSEIIDGENIYKCSCELKVQIRTNNLKSKEYDECILNGNDGCLGHLF
tara:strand:+ start:3581 stop:3889 length:309 start_codon:yes stop_codon:yes gene_type:complete